MISAYLNGGTVSTLSSLGAPRGVVIEGLWKQQETEVVGDSRTVTHWVSDVFEWPDEHDSWRGKKLSSVLGNLGAEGGWKQGAVKEQARIFKCGKQDRNEDEAAVLLPTIWVRVWIKVNFYNQG